MKKEDLKITIGNGDDLEKMDRRSNQEYKTIGLITAFLLFLAMVMTVVFTLQSFNGLTDLRKEIKVLKFKVNELQERLEETNRVSCKFYFFVLLFAIVEVSFSESVVNWTN